MRPLLTLLLLVNTFLSTADAWDNLTYEEAQQVVNSLKKNPYIFDYCDCCSHDGEYATAVFFLRVISTEIVQCDWAEEYYSVKYTAEKIAQVEYLSSGVNQTNLFLSQDEFEENNRIYMNYTWTFHPTTKMAVPFFDVVTYTTYGEASPCKKPFQYPTPKQVAAITKVKGYKRWYNRVM